MIILFLIDVFITILGIIFSFLPAVTVLPNIFGYDIDSALVTGIGSVNQFIFYFWPVGYLYQGFLVILGYHIAKITFRLFFGHRTPS